MEVEEQTRSGRSRLPRDLCVCACARTESVGCLSATSRLHSRRRRRVVNDAAATTISPAQMLFTKVENGTFSSLSSSPGNNIRKQNECPPNITRTTRQYHLGLNKLLVYMSYLSQASLLLDEYLHS